MQDGIGRGGYRLLAAVFLGIGLLGLVATLYAFLEAGGMAMRGGLFDWLGFGLSFVALGALFALSLVILWKPARVATPVAMAPTPAPTPTTIPPPPPVAPAPEPDLEAEPETGPEVAIPLPPPTIPMVVQPNRNLAKDTKGWPRRQPPSGLTLGEKRRLEAEAMQMLAANGNARTIELAPRPSRVRASAPAVMPSRAGAPNGSVRNSSPVGNPAATSGPAEANRPMTIRVQPPATVARVAGPDDDPTWNPEGTTVGKCGGCGTRLYAPPQRPLNLRCPKCDRATLLQ